MPSQEGSLLGTSIQSAPKMVKYYFILDSRLTFQSTIDYLIYTSTCILDNVNVHINTLEYIFRRKEKVVHVLRVMNCINKSVLESYSRETHFYYQ